MNKTENTASRLTDAVEGAFHRGVMTHEEYVRCLKAINEWALDRYSKLAADAPVIVGFAETEKVA